MNLRPHRLQMKTKASKRPRKVAPPAPLRLTGLTGASFSSFTLYPFLFLLTSRELSGMLRARGIGIPKDKETMIARLIDWLTRQEGKFSLTLS